MYSTTSPKLKTSLLKGFIETILFTFEYVFINYGAKNGRVPKIVDYFSFYLAITLQLPTSHSFNVIF